MSLANQVRSTVRGAADALTREAMRRPIPTPRDAVAALVGHDSVLQRAVAGHTAVVTGASSGIGEATARMLAEAGARVILVARRKQELERVAETIAVLGGKAEVQPCDLSDRAAVAALGARLAAREDAIDILVNNAGRSIRRPMLDTVDRFHDLERTMELNYYAPAALMLALLPGMVERKDGRVVNISTWGTRIGGPLFAPYTASKAALDLFSWGGDLEVRADGVSISTVHMPLVRTPMIAPSLETYRGITSIGPEDAAGLVAYALITRSVRVEPAFVTAVHLMDTVSSQLTSAAMGLVARAAGVPQVGDRSGAS